MRVVILSSYLNLMKKAKEMRRAEDKGNYIMEKEQKLQMLDEIKRIERELYLRRSRLASVEAMESGANIYKGLDPKEWKEVFAQLTKEIGNLSNGGNSVEDIKRERER